jgi:LysR family nitrogen assimilation transcriptional regulator
MPPPRGRRYAVHSLDGPLVRMRLRRPAKADLNVRIARFFGTTASGETISYMDLDRLKVFVQVADAGSLSKAAVLLDSMQSAISRQIAALEREAGRRLFDRTGRGVTLTEFGKRLYPEAKALLQESRRLQDLLHGRDERPAGEVRIGLMPSVAELLVADLFQEVRAQYPGIRLRLFEGSNGQLDEWVQIGHLDMAVLYRYGQGARRNEDALFEVETFLVGAPGDPLANRPTVSFAELNHLPLVLPGAPNGLRVALDQLARRQAEGFRLNIVLEADSLPIQRSMAAHGAAYAVHGGVVVGRDVRAGVVSAARIVEPGLRRTLVLATTTQHPLSVAARATMPLLRRVALDHAPEPSK